MSKIRTLSVTELSKKQFQCLEFDGDWKEMFGNPEVNFRLMFYGPPKSGKSTMVLKFSNYLAEKFGKVLYNSHEEGHSETLKKRIIDNQITSKSLFIGHLIPFEEMLAIIKPRRYRFIIIDSVNYMNMNYHQYQLLIKTYPTKGFIFIAQVNGKGAVKGGTDIKHAVDGTVYMSNGTAHIQTRFAPEKTIQIFKPTTKIGHTLPLISNTI